jgi:xanthine dehydrogenase accessory factor
MTSTLQRIHEAIQAEEALATVTVIRGAGLGRKLLVWPDGRTHGGLGGEGLTQAAITWAAEQLSSQQSARFAHEEAGESWELFVDVHIPRPRLIIVGGVHIAIPLVTFAKALGFYTLVVDARSAFATPERFAHADELIIRWPADVLGEMALGPSTYVVTLTHDEKLDNPALVVALNHPVRYVGALGSRRTHAKRVAQLQAEGISEEQMARIHAPIGLDLGGRSPEEIALAIMAEIVQVRNRG